MKLSQELVKQVGKLANLPLTSKEEEKYSEQLSKVLDYIDKLNSVEIAEVEPTYNVSGLESVMAEDQEGDCTLSQEESLANAREKKDGFFVTKGVFNNE